MTVLSNLSKHGLRDTWTTLLTTETPTIPNMAGLKKLISKVLKIFLMTPGNSDTVALVLPLLSHIAKALIMLVYILMPQNGEIGKKTWQFLTKYF